MRSRATALAVVPLLLLATACGSSSSSDDESSQESGAALAGVKIEGVFNEAPDVTVKDLKASETESEVLIEGDGPKASKDSQSLVQLVVLSGVDGQKFFSTFDTQPVTVGGGSRPLMNGLDEAIDGVARGSRVAFKSSASDAVGAEGVGQLGLKADDAVVAVVDILSVADPEPLEGPEGDEQEAPAGTPKLVEKDGNVTNFDWAGVGAKPDKLHVVTLIEGDGPAIEKNRLVTFDYFGEVFKSKKPFDESYSKAPVTFMVGAGGLIKAWDEGLIGVKEGSRVLITTPPATGYGDQANGDIPANSTLTFVIDVLGVDG